jgi:adenylate cyclase
MTEITFTIQLDDGSSTSLQRPPGSYILGRDPRSDIVLHSLGASRRHARIEVSEEAVSVEDLGSSGGTYGNGQRLREPTTFPLPVTLQLGQMHVTIACEHPRAATAPALHAEAPRAEPKTREAEPHINLALNGAVHAPPPIQNLNEQTRRRLGMLYELPLQFAAESDLQKLYKLILDRVIELTPGAIRGALLIKDPHDGKLGLRASIPLDAPAISRTLIRRVAREQVGFIWGDKDADHQSLSESMAAIRIRTGMYAPLVWEGDTVGVLFVDNPNTRAAFSEEDLQFLLSVAHYAASAVANQLLQTEIKQNNQTLQHLLANFSPKLRNRLLEKSREGRLQPGGEKSLVTILLSDLRGFTRTSASLDAQIVVDILNDYFQVLGEEIFRHDGTIDKFIGDAILAVFGSPEKDPEHPFKAVCAAIEMQRKMAMVNARRKKAGLPFCDLGIGVHTGEVLHGFIGAEERLEYTVIGDTVNKTSRYCDGAAAGEILLGPLTAQELKGRVAMEKRSIATKHEGDLPAFAVAWHE